MSLVVTQMGATGGDLGFGGTLGLVSSDLTHCSDSSAPRRQLRLTRGEVHSSARFPSSVGDNLGQAAVGDHAPVLAGLLQLGRVVPRLWRGGRF